MKQKRMLAFLMTFLMLFSITGGMWTVSADDQGTIRLSDGMASRTSDAEAEVTFNSNLDGTCYYHVGYVEHITYADVTTKWNTTPMLKGENSIALSSLDAGAQKVYIYGIDGSNSNNFGGLTLDLPAYIPSVRNVTFTVTDGMTDPNAPVAGAIVNFNGTAYTTAEDGTVTINDIGTGLYHYTAAHSGYITANGTIAAGSADAAETVALKKPFLSTSSVVTGGQENPKFVIELANDTFDVDWDHFQCDVPNGAGYGLGSVNAERNRITLYLLGTVKAGSSVYLQFYGAGLTSGVDSNILKIDIKSPENVVGFEVKDGSSKAPIEGATVTFEGKEAAFITAADGSITIPDVKPGTYHYTVTKAGYLVNKGTATINDDGKGVLVNVELKAPVISTTSAIYSGLANPCIDIELKDDTFQDIDHITFDPGTTGLQKGMIQLADDKKSIKLYTTGRTKAGTINVQAMGAGLTGGIDSNLLSITVGDEENRSLTLQVVDNSNSSFISGATVVLTEGQPGGTSYSAITDSTGNADFTVPLHLEEPFTYSITKEGYEKAEGSLSLGEDPYPRRMVSISQIPVAVTFHVMDQKNQPISGAAVSFCQKTVITDASGCAVVYSASGSYSFAITCSGYFTFGSGIYVEHSPIDLNIQMQQQLSATIKVKDKNGNPIPDIVISNEDKSTATTDVSGQAVFHNLRSSDNILCSITDTKYHSVAFRLGLKNGSVEKEIVLIPVSEANITHKVVIHVKDSDTGNAIEGASVELGDTNKVTDANGQAVFENVDQYSYLEYVVKKAHYYSSNSDVSPEDRFVAVEEMDVNFDVSLIPVNPTYYVAAYGNGRFVVVGSNGSIRTSSDHYKTFSESQTDFGLNGVTFANGKFTAVGNNREVLTSSDGVTWEKKIIDPNGNAFLGAVAYGNHLYVAVGGDYTYEKGVVYTSTNGTDWVPVDLRGLSVNVLWGITYGNGKFVAVGDEGSIITSENGTDWTERVAGVRSDTNFYGITFGDGKFVAVGSESIVFLSSDGIDWVPAKINTDDIGWKSRGNFGSAAYDGEKFTAVGSYGKVFTSADGSVWTDCGSFSDSDLWTVAFGGGELVAAGSNGTIITLNGLDILRAYVKGQSTSAEIDPVNHTVILHIQYGADVTALKPNLLVSLGASLSPASEETKDFTNPVTYTVSKGEARQDWTVSCKVDSEPGITSFKVNGQTGNSTINLANHTVSFHMPYGTDVKALIPEIQLSKGCLISPASGTVQDFTNPVTYTLKLRPVAVKTSESITLEPGVIPSDTYQSSWIVTCVVDGKPDSSSAGTSKGSSGSATSKPIVVEDEKTALSGIFSDAIGHWAQKEIEKLASLGIIGGYPDGTIHPNASITRAEAAKSMVNALGLTTDGGELGQTFTDSTNIPDWAKNFVLTVVNKQIMKGYADRSFKAGNNLTRAEMTAIVMRSFQLGESDKELSFADNKDIPSWCKGYIAKAVELGIITGYPEDNTFKPNRMVTRAEFFSTVAKCLEIK